MTYRKPNKPLTFTLSAIVLLLVGTLTTDVFAQNDPAQSAVDTAFDVASSADSYTFSTHLIQTIYPPPQSWQTLADVPPRDNCTSTAQLIR